MSTITKAQTVALPIAALRFAGHFLEMCVVMCVGGGLLDFVVFSAAAPFAYPGLHATAPELAIVIIGVDAALVMAVYMYLRGHSLQHNIEMSATTALVAIPLLAASWLGWLPQSAFASWGTLFVLLCTPLCAVMLIAMLIRFEHYSGRMSTVAAAAAVREWTCTMHPEVRHSQQGRCPFCGMTLVRAA